MSAFAVLFVNAMIYITCSSFCLLVLIDTKHKTERNVSKIVNTAYISAIFELAMILLIIAFVILYQLQHDITYQSVVVEPTALPLQEYIKWLHTKFHVLLFLIFYFQNISIKISISQSM